MALLLISSLLHAVLALVVPSEIHFPLEAFGTNVTSKRFKTCVFPAVGDQVGALAERFTTHLAFVGFFTGVNVGVFLHVRFLVEPLAAVLAGVRPRVGVDEQVCGESGGAFEGFATHFTLKAFFLRVDIHVLLQTDSVAEGFSADVAAKRPRSAVRPPDVDLQPVGRREHLVTGDAVVGVGGWRVVRAAVQRLLRL